MFPPPNFGAIGHADICRAVAPGLMKSPPHPHRRRSLARLATNNINCRIKRSCTVLRRANSVHARDNMAGGAGKRPQACPPPCLPYPMPVRWSATASSASASAPDYAGQMVRNRQLLFRFRSGLPDALLPPPAVLELVPPSRPQPPAPLQTTCMRSITWLVGLENARKPARPHACCPPPCRPDGPQPPAPLLPALHYTPSWLAANLTAFCGFSFFHRSLR
jgi:hypothetical protein